MDDFQTQGFAMKTVDTLNDALFYQLQGIYDADQKILDAMPDFIDGASSPDLKVLLTKYLKNTGSAQNKLTWVYEFLDRRVKSRTNKVIAELVQEASSVISHASSNEVLDAILVSYIHLMCNYKTAIYRSCRAFAHEMRLHQIYDIFNDLYIAEKKFDQEFKLLAFEHLNEKAFEASFLRKN
ncbi:MAG TPA: DUF892 family protein [Cyclobacteriaceae bacterium]|nr:DUF892 family protein [Cyclobacteriaceae bacterium]